MYGRHVCTGMNHGTHDGDDSLLLTWFSRRFALDEMAGDAGHTLYFQNCFDLLQGLTVATKWWWYGFHNWRIVCWMVWTYPKTPDLTILLPFPLVFECCLIMQNVASMVDPPIQTPSAGHDGALPIYILAFSLHHHVSSPTRISIHLLLYWHQSIQKRFNGDICWLCKALFLSIQIVLSPIRRHQADTNA